MLMRNLDSAYLCPLLATKNFKLVAEWAAALGHSWRARCLLQLGNIFKLQAREVTPIHGSMRPCRDGTTSCPRESHGKLPRSVSNPGCRQLKWHKKAKQRQVEYTIAVTQLHSSLQTPLRPLVRASGSPSIQVHSICHYRADPTSRTTAQCPLPELSVPNHRAYAERHGYKYVLHTELPLPDREAHYSKMLVIHEALARQKLL